MLNALVDKSLTANSYGPIGHRGNFTFVVPNFRRYIILIYPHVQFHCSNVQQQDPSRVVNIPVEILVAVPLDGPVHPVSNVR